MSANSFHFTLDFSNHLSNFAVGCDDNEKFCKFPGQIHTWRPGWESNPDHENHELSAFYVPDTVLVLFLLLQFCNNNKEIWSPESVRNLTKHTAEPEILSQLSPTVTPSSLTISNAPGPQGRVVFLPPPGTRPPCHGRAAQGSLKAGGCDEYVRKTNICPRKGREAWKKKTPPGKPGKPQGSNWKGLK